MNISQVVNVDPKKGWKIGSLKNDVHIHHLSVIHFTDTYGTLQLEMAKLLCSEKLLCKLLEMENSSFVENDIKTEVSKAISTRLIPVELLPTISFFLKETGSDETLPKLLINCKLTFPSFKKIQEEPSVELQRRRKFLHKRSQEKEYERMIEGSKVSTISNEFSMSVSSMKYATSISVNMIVTMVAMYGIFYYIGKQFALSSSHCMACGLLGAGVMMVIELILFIIRTGQAEQKESKLK